jgi:hypothetical protein
VTDSHHVYATCRETAGGYRCSVRVGDDDRATTHDVSVTAADVQRLAPPTTNAETLVRESFHFLLEREPRESILGSFDLPVIARYFAEYPREIHRRLSGGNA